MTRKVSLYLSDIVSSIHKIEDYTKGMSIVNFKKDEKTIDAVIRNLEIIGEAAKNIPKEIKDKHPVVPWRAVIGMRNKVIHEYFGVDVEVLWKTIKEDIVFLKEKTQEIQNGGQK